MTPNGESSSTPYRLEFESRPDYLHIQIHGARTTLDAARQMVRELAAALKKSPHAKVLVEMDVEEPLSTADNYWLVSEFTDLDMYRYAIAVVNPKPEHQEIYNFADMVAYNRGLTIQSFTTAEEAEEWLL